jgi:hypothetical protein
VVAEQTEPPELNTDIPDIKYYDDGTAYVEVPLTFLRNALWYYEAYFIAQDTIEKKNQVIEDYQELAGTRLDLYETAESLRIKARAEADTLKTVTIFLTIICVGNIAIDTIATIAGAK